MSRMLALSGLTMLGLGLAATIGLELTDGDTPEDAVAAIARPATMAIERASPAARPVNRTAPILARPLFAANRRPPPPAPAAGTATRPVTQTHDLPRLAGIAVSLGTRLAIFQPKDSDKAIVVGLGGQIAGRKVTAIASSEVVVEGPDGPLHLHPLPDPMLVPTPIAAPALPSPPPASPPRATSKAPRNRTNQEIRRPRKFRD